MRSNAMRAGFRIWPQKLVPPTFSCPIQRLKWWLWVNGS